MASKMRYRKGPLVTVLAAKSGTVAIEEGDMLKLNTSRTLTPVTASGDYTAFVGVAMQASPATDVSGTRITLGLPGNNTVFEFPVGDTDRKFTFGDFLKITGDQELSYLTGTSVVASGTNAVGFCVESQLATGDSVLVIFRKTKYFTDLGGGA